MAGHMLLVSQLRPRRTPSPVLAEVSTTLQARPIAMSSISPDCTCGNTWISLFTLALDISVLSVTVEAHLLGSQHPGHVLLVGQHQQGHTVQPRPGWRMGRLTVAIIIKDV